MEIRKKNLNTPVRFYLDEENEVKEGRERQFVDICLCAGDDLQAIIDETTEKVVEFLRPTKPSGKEDKRAQPQRVEHEKKDDKLYRRLLWDSSIRNWLIYDEDTGELIPCTADEKVELMGGSIEFSTFIVNCIDVLNEQSDKQRAMIEKNLSSSQRPLRTSLTVDTAEESSG